MCERQDQARTQEDPKIFNDRSTPLQVNPPRNQGSVLANVRQSRWFASGGATYTDKAFWADVLDSRFWGTTRARIGLLRVPDAGKEDGFDAIRALDRLLSHPHLCCLDQLLASLAEEQAAPSFDDGSVERHVLCLEA